MKTNRLEAFSDGMIAIFITVMVLELKAPHEPTLAALRPLVPELLSYLLSFIYLGIYWNNHHHTFQAAKRVTGGVLWANLHLLFWLSLIPFTTAWAGENQFKATPTALYGAVLLCSSIAFMILVRTLTRIHDDDSPLVRAIGNNRKSWISTALYAAAIPLSFWQPWIGSAIYAAVALMWLVPAPHIERQLEQAAEEKDAPTHDAD